MVEKFPLCVTFNRTMKWLDDQEILNGSIIAYSAGKQLWLTGKKIAFNWQTEPEDVEYKAISDTDSSILLWCRTAFPYLKLKSAT